jgi:hypothetical protein
MGVALTCIVEGLTGVKSPHTGTCGRMRGVARRTALTYQLHVLMCCCDPTLYIYNLRVCKTVSESLARAANATCLAAPALLLGALGRRLDLAPHAFRWRCFSKGAGMCCMCDCEMTLIVHTALSRPNDAAISPPFPGAQSTTATATTHPQQAHSKHTHPFSKTRARARGRAPAARGRRTQSAEAPPL